jgi:hypothetical protein
MRFWPDNTMRRWQSLSLIASLILVALLLGACGNDDDKADEPTVTRAPATVPSEPTTSATLEADEITAGEIADRVATAWAVVTQYSSITEILPAADASPVASPASDAVSRAERMVILPDTKRIAITETGVTTEIVLVDGVISKRVTANGGQPGSWQTVNPANVAPDDPYAQTYSTMLAPEQPPYSGLSDRQRERIGTRIGETEIDGRTCTSYSFPEVGETGEQISIVISLDASDLPCRIETSTASSISRTDYTINGPVEFATPTNP